MRARISSRFHFEAAHFMPTYPEGHPNRRMHGHSYTGEVVLEGEVEPVSGMVMEHETLARAVGEIVQSLDHSLLNEIKGLETPTGEHISKWIYDQLKPLLRGLKEVSVSRETVGVKITYSEEMQK
jgi:6-pyruvoyltetrahydropterin/6-carboxytetrahydropterin synthase